MKRGSIINWSDGAQSDLNHTQHMPTSQELRQNIKHGSNPRKIYYKKIIPVAKLLSEKAETKNKPRMLSTRVAKV